MYLLTLCSPINSLFCLKYGGRGVSHRHHTTVYPWGLWMGRNACLPMGMGRSPQCTMPLAVGTRTHGMDQCCHETG